MHLKLVSASIVIFFSGFNVSASAVDCSYWRTELYWNENVIILTKFASLVTWLQWKLLKWQLPLQPGTNNDNISFSVNLNVPAFSHQWMSISLNYDRKCALWWLGVVNTFAPIPTGNVNGAKWLDANQSSVLCLHKIAPHHMTHF